MRSEWNRGKGSTMARMIAKDAGYTSVLLRRKLGKSSNDRSLCHLSCRTARVALFTPMGACTRGNGRVTNDTVR